MNRVYVFLPVIILMLSQEIFCAFYSQKAISAYENQGVKETLRGHDDLLQQMQTQRDAEKTIKENIVMTGRSTPLKDSTDKVNEKR